MKTRTLGALLGGVLVMMAVAASAQAPAPIMKFTFDSDTEGWTAMGVNARAAISEQGSWNGKGSLKFEYDVKKGNMGALIHEVADGAFAKAASIRFWARADYPTSIAFILQEKGEVRYIAPVALPRGAWQEVLLSPADFVMLEGFSAPDPDNKLDLDQVNGIGLADVAQLIGMAGSPEMETLLGVVPGAHAIGLDDFTVTDKPVAPSCVAEGADLRLDTFARPQFCWLVLGGASLTKAVGKAVPGPALQADYRQASKRVMGLLRPIPRGKLQGYTKLTFTAAASKPTTLIVQLEETGGGKFNTVVILPEGTVPNTTTVNFADMNPGDDSKVKDRKVDPSLVTQVLFIDASGIVGTASEADNTLLIGGLKASK